MSATNRGSIRHAADFYATPKEAFIPLVPSIRSLGLPVWEPACGDGRLIEWLIDSGIEADGTDIDAKIVDNKDFLKDESRRECIVTNPPFSLAFEFCQHAVSHADHVFLLLRLNFLASLKRRDWFWRNEPDALFILSKRPCFTNDGKTDATDYAWYYWGYSRFKPFNHL